MSRLRSSLAQYAAVGREPDPAAARRAAREAYHQTGIVLINPQWLPSWVDQQALRNLADQVHGPRPKPPG